MTSTKRKLAAEFQARVAMPTFGLPAVLASNRTQATCLLVAAIGLLGWAIALPFGLKYALSSYLTAWFSVFSIGLGLLFVILLHHVTGSLWTTVLRRPAEIALGAAPLMALLFLPVLLGMGAIYKWTDPAYTTGDPLYEVKGIWLTRSFFIARAVLYFSVLFALIGITRGLSFRQDSTGDPAISRRQGALSAPGMFAYALMLTFMSFDWLMSLDYHWFSTIYGVYVFNQSAVAAFAVLGLMAWRLKAGALRGKVGIDQHHDAGKLTFAFAVFWAYIAYSQWFLIWYANIPEETGWMLLRAQGPWPFISLLMVVALFIVPFVVLMPSFSKRTRGIYTPVSLIILAGHYLSIYWLVMPHAVKTGQARPLFAVLIDLATLALVAGLVGWKLNREHALHPLVPLHDPRMAEYLIAVAGHHHHGHDDEGQQPHEHGDSPLVAGEHPLTRSSESGASS